MDSGRIIYKGTPQGARLDKAVQEAYLEDVTDIDSELLSGTRLIPVVNEPILWLDGVSVNIDKHQILDDISMELLPGQIACLIGPNGSGKTTTLRAISGTTKISSGSVTFAGHPITNLPSYLIARMGILHIPQDVGVFPQLTVIENLYLSTFGHSYRIQRRDEINTVLETFPFLANKMNQAAETLSGGEQRALSLIRALILPHKILLLDEPSIGLSPILRKHFYELIRKLASDGSAVLIVEQRVMDVLHISDVAYVLMDGKIEVSGSPSEIKESKVLMKFLPLVTQSEIAKGD